MSRNLPAKLLFSLAAGTVILGAHPEPARAILFVSNVNNTFAPGPIVDITLQPDGNIASVRPNFIPNQFYSSILKFNENTGDFLGSFVPQGIIHFSSGITFNGNYFYANDQGCKVDPTFVSGCDDSSPERDPTKKYGRILKFDARTGSLIGEFISGANLTANGLNFPEDLLFGPNGNLYISGLGGGGVQEFDGITGAYVRTVAGFNSQGKDLIAAGFNVGPDGNLYISSVLNDNSILRYNPVTSAVDTFIPPSSAQCVPSGSVFTPDGNFLLNGTFIDPCNPGAPVSIARFAAGTGARLPDFVPAPGSDNGGLQSSSRLRFDAGGNFFASDFAASQIMRYTIAGLPNPILPNGGAVFAPAGLGGLSNPGGLALFDPASIPESSTLVGILGFGGALLVNGAFKFKGKKKRSPLEDSEVI